MATSINLECIGKALHKYAIQTKKINSGKLPVIGRKSE